MNTSWLTSVSLVKERLGEACPGLTLGIARYRLLQIRDALEQDWRQKGGNDYAGKLWPYLSAWEKVLVKAVKLVLAVAAVLPEPLRDRVLKALRFNHLAQKYGAEAGAPCPSLIAAYERLA